MYKQWHTQTRHGTACAIRPGAPPPPPPRADSRTGSLPYCLRVRVHVWEGGGGARIVTFHCRSCTFNTTGSGRTREGGGVPDARVQPRALRGVCTARARARRRLSRERQNFPFGLPISSCCSGSTHAFGQPLLGPPLPICRGSDFSCRQTAIVCPPTAVVFPPTVELDGRESLRGSGAVDYPPTPQHTKPQLQAPQWGSRASPQLSTEGTNPKDRSGRNIPLAPSPPPKHTKRNQRQVALPFRSRSLGGPK